MRYAAQLASAIAIALASGSTAKAQTTPDLALTQVLGGKPVAPALTGNQVYLPTGRIITAIDYQDPAQPIIKGDTSVDPATGQIVGVAQHGRYLYAAWDTYDNNSGVAVYSILDPDQPQLIGDVTNYTSSSFRNATSIAAGNGRLYLLDSENGIFVANLSTPGLPQFELGLQAYGSWDEAYVKGDRLYTTGRGWTFERVIEVFDIQTPDQPVSLGYAALDGDMNFSLAFDVPMAYGFGYGFSIHDISDPANVVHMSTSDFERDNPSGFVFGNHAYAIGYTDIQPWLVTNPANPTPYAPISMDTFATDFSIPFKGDALLFTRADRVARISIDDPVKPQYTSEFLVKGAVDVADIAFVGDKALLLQSTYGLQVADAESLQPESRVEMDIPPLLRARVFEQMHIAGDIAYLASWGSGLFMVDISDPASPQQIGHWEQLFTSSVDVSDGIAAVGKVSAVGGLHLIDVSDPTRPFQRSELEFVYAIGLKMFEDRIFVADTNAGLRVVDITNIDAPRLSGLYDNECTIALALSLSSDGDTVYMLCASTGLHIVDVSSPDNPVRTGRLDLGGETNIGAVAVRGNVAYVGSDLGFDEIDISDPTQPTLIARHPLASSARSIRFAPDGRVVVMGGTAGLHIFESTDSLFEDGFDGMPQ